MRRASEVPAEYLVVDSGVFIKGAPLQDLGSKIYTVTEVLAELKCGKSRHFIESVPYEILTKEPTPQSVKIIADISKKTGDYSALSVVDIKVLALAHDFYVEQYGESVLNYDIEIVKSTDNANPPETNVSTEALVNGENQISRNDGAVEGAGFTPDVAGFYKPSDKAAVAGGGSGSEEASTSSEDEGGWIDESTLDSALQKLGAIVVPETNVKVACITTDFAMQNVLLHMHLPLLSLDGYRIRRLRSYILRCRVCYKTTSDMERRFCKYCGNEALHRVAVTVNDDGSMQMHINWRRLMSKKGLKYSLPAPKGGKHAKDPQLFEDQRIPHNRMAKRDTSSFSADPFAMNDVNSRSAALGIRSFQVRNCGNPNSPKGGKKRGGKKR